MPGHRGPGEPRWRRHDSRVRLIADWDSTFGGVSVHYDPNTEIRTLRDIQVWEAAVCEAFDPFLEAHGRFPLVVCIDDIRIHPSVAADYREMTKRVVGTYTTICVRWGRRSTNRSIIAVAALGGGYSANLADSFDEAVALVQQQRAA